MKIRVCRLVPGYKVGEELEIEADHEGTPFDFHHRRRLKDGTFERVKTARKTTPRKPVEKRDDKHEESTK